MTRNDFIEWLKQYEDKLNVRYYEAYPDYDGIYVERKRADEDEYHPYIRVSDFEDEDEQGQWYVRDNGWCEYREIERILEDIKELAMS